MKCLQALIYMLMHCVHQAKFIHNMEFHLGSLQAKFGLLLFLAIPFPSVSSFFFFFLTKGSQVQPWWWGIITRSPRGSVKKHREHFCCSYFRSYFEVEYRPGPVCPRSKCFWLHVLLNKWRQLSRLLVKYCGKVSCCFRGKCAWNSL